MKHYHTLIRVKAQFNNIFMCADSECSWTRRREYLTNKKFKCPFCGEIYLVSSEMLRRKMPHCSDCTIGKGKIPQLVGLLPMNDLVQIEEDSNAENQS